MREELTHFLGRESKLKDKSDKTQSWSGDMELFRANALNI